MSGSLLVFSADFFICEVLDSLCAVIFSLFPSCFSFPPDTHSQITWPTIQLFYVATMFIDFLSGTVFSWWIEKRWRRSLRKARMSNMFWAGFDYIACDNGRLNIESANGNCVGLRLFWKKKKPLVLFYLIQSETWIVASLFSDNLNPTNS